MNFDNFKNKKILIFVAHQDDESIAMGGTIRLLQKNNKVFVVSFTDGILSRNDSKNFNYKKNYEVRKKEANHASKILNFKWYKEFIFPDNSLDSIPRLELIKEIEKIIIELKPSYIFTHSFSDLNIDHRIINQCVSTACRPGIFNLIKGLFFFEIITSTHFRFDKSSEYFSPSIYVNIEKQLNYKIKACKAYKSETINDRVLHINKIISLNSFRGSQINCKYAESFDLGYLIS